MLPRARFGGHRFQDFCSRRRCNTFRNIICLVSQDIATVICNRCCSFYGGVIKKFRSLANRSVNLSIEV